MTLVPTASAEPDLHDLVKRAREGDAVAFEGLYRRLTGRVYGVCLRMARSEEEAQELAQEAWIRAWEKLGSFRGESRFTTWLHRLTVNLILDHRRRDRRWRARFELVDEPAPLEKRSAPGAPPGLRMDLDRAVAALPDGARTVFLLYDVEGYKHQEIARHLGVAEGTVKAQLHRARQILREVLER